MVSIFPDANMSRTAMVKVPACRRTLMEQSVDELVDVDERRFEIYIET